VGDAVRLYVDANGAYSADQAPGYSRAMADAGAMMVEDPCALVPDAGFRKLQQDSPVPLLVDFGCTSLRDAALFIDQEARALSVKPGRFGLSSARAMEQLARQSGCASVVGLMGESALGTFAALQFAAALPHLNPMGFKILLDLLVHLPPGTTVREIPVRFGARRHGASKLSRRVQLQFLEYIYDVTLGRGCR